jgi:molecular chaperone GrpE
VTPGMSKKVQVEIQGDDDLDQSEKETNAKTNTEESRKNIPEPEPEEDGDSSEGDLDEKLREAESKAEDYYDRLLRASAEFDNYKKRTTREMRDVVRYANEKLFKELLFVVDNLERAIDAVEQDNPDDDPLLQGVRLTLAEVEKILERNNVTPIEALGQAFDPNFHQAMMQEETEEQPANTVIKEMQKGYVLHDRLLRPAMVVVSKAATKEG